MNAALRIGLILSASLTCLAQAQTQPSTFPTTTQASGHQLKLADRTIQYDASAGFIELKDDDGKLRAKVFHVAYEQSGEGAPAKADRPITFVFNGGPGAASIWLHMGTAGPKRVDLPENGFVPAPPYRLADNPNSWLDFTDLVFIDPVGTGYSRAEADKGKEFYGVEGDIQSVGEVIERFLTTHQRWESPKFVAGESYGTTRAAALSGHLHDRYGIDANGIVLISTVLNFQTLDFQPGNDSGYPLWLPSYAAIAHYHKKLSADLQKLPVDQLVKQVQTYAADVYMPALLRGASLPEAQQKQVAQQVAAYTGLPVDFVTKARMKISPFRFEKTLLADQEKVIGRMDGRISGHDADPLNDSPDFDPSLTGYIGVFSNGFNDYIRRVLDFKSDEIYEFLSPRVQPWNWGRERGYLDVSPTLRSAMTSVPTMKLAVCSGYYDLATPFTAADYTVNQMPLGPELRKNVSQFYFEGGHMFYLNHPALVKLHDNLKSFYTSAIPTTAPAGKQ